MLLKFLPRGRLSSDAYASSQGSQYKPWQDSIRGHSGQPVNLLGFFTEPGVGVLTGGMDTPSPTGHTWKNLPNREWLPSRIEGAPALDFLGLYILHCLPQATYSGARWEGVAGFSGKGSMLCCLSMWGCTLSIPSWDDLWQSQGAVGYPKMAVAWLLEQLLMAT